jgi:glutathione transport system substrate-binding protein
VATANRRRDSVRSSNEAGPGHGGHEGEEFFVKRSRHGTLGIASLVTLCLVAAACQGSPTKTQQAAIPASAVDINEKPRDQLQDGGTLTLALSEMPPNFNPNHADGTLGDNYDVVLHMLPGPFDTDAEARFHVDKRFFDSVELTSTDPKQVVTYNINPKAVWLDGTPITWKDLESEWKATNGSNPAFEVASTQGYDKIESVVRGKDDGEVIVTYAQKYADWQGPFSPLLPAASTATPDAFNKGWVDHPATSAGPFRYDSIDKTAKTITLVRNERWWGDRAKLDRVIFRVIDIDAQIDALANGEIDMVDIGPDVNAYKRAQTMKGVDIRKAGGPDFRHATINAQSEILSDLKVRRAFALSIDRNAIATALLSAVDLPPAPQGNHIYMHNQAGYRDNSGEFEKQDLRKAGTLLDEAGWKLNGQVREKGGKQLKLRLVIPSGVTQADQESRLIQQQVKAAGILVDILTVPSGDFFQKYVYPGDYDICIFRWAGTPFPISSAKSIYAEPKPGPDGQLDLQQNYARIGSDEIDKLFDEATQVFDTNQAADLGNQIDALIWQEVHSIPLYQRPQIVGVKSKLANIGALGFTVLHIENVGYVKGAGSPTQ